jgi:plasmid replication initiation protein
MTFIDTVIESLKMKNAELVVKSNRLIEASYRLGLTEQRIILYAICRGREEDKLLRPNEPVVISAEAFLKHFPSIGEGNVYEQLKDAMDALYERSVTLYETDADTGLPQVSKTRWISKASYVDGAGRIKVVFTSDVIKYFTRLEEEFTTYQLEKAGRMTSFHAVRIYELLAQHKSIGNRTLNLKWLRERLGVEPGEYKLTADFIRKVIDVAVDQINRHSDLTVSYKPQKTGRAITDFVFKIKGKDAKPKARSAPNDQAAREKLEALGQQRLDTETNEEF